MLTHAGHQDHVAPISQTISQAPPHLAASMPLDIAVLNEHSHVLYKICACSTAPLYATICSYALRYTLLYMVLQNIRSHADNVHCSGVHALLPTSRCQLCSMTYRCGWVSANKGSLVRERAVGADVTAKYGQHGWLLSSLG